MFDRLIDWISHQGRTGRALRRVKAWPIRELPEGVFGRVIGTARPVDLPLIAPISGRACVWYRVDVSGQGIATIRESRAVPFALEDSSGRVVVDSSGADLAIPRDHYSVSGTWQDASPAQEAFLARHGVKSTGWVFNKELIYQERIIGIGMMIHAAGILVRDLEPGSPFRAAGPTVMRLSRSPTSPLLIGRLKS
jgi:hypothetical protein